MSTTAYCVPLEREIDTANLSDEEWEFISSTDTSQYSQARPLATCLVPEGNNGPMYRTQRNGQFYLAHYPGGNTENHDHNTTPMTAEHKNQTEYIRRAAQSAGLKTQGELSTGKNTRLDLAVYGEHNTGFEVQWSSLSNGMVQSRATRSFDAGWPTAWITTGQPSPSWTKLVPSVRISDIEWSEELPTEGTVSATITEFYTEVFRRVTLKDRDTAIPLDEFVVRVVSGDIIAVTGPDGPTFTDASALGMLTEFGHKIWTPDYTPKKRNANRIRDCHSHERTFVPEPVMPPVITPPVIDVRGRQAERDQATRQWLDAERDFVQSWLDAEQDFTQAARQDAEKAALNFVQSWLEAEFAWWRDVNEIPCSVCGLPINPAFRTFVHYDCARRTRNAA